MMNCIHFDGSQCGGIKYFYTPTDEEKKELCESTEFRQCSRFVAYLELLEAKNG